MSTAISNLSNVNVSTSAYAGIRIDYDARDLARIIDLFLELNNEGKYVTIADLMLVIDIKYIKGNRFVAFVDPLNPTQEELNRQLELKEIIRRTAPRDEQDVDGYTDDLLKNFFPDGYFVNLADWSFDELISSGTSFFDAIFYLGLENVNRGKVGMAFVVRSKGISQQLIAEALTFQVVCLMLNGNWNKSVAVDDKPNILKSLSAKTSKFQGNGAAYCSTLASFEIEKVPKQFLEHLDVSKMMEELTNRIGLSVAGYRDLKPAQSIVPSIMKGELVRPWEVYKSFTVEPLCFTLAAATKESSVTSLYGSLSHGARNLFGLVCTVEQIAELTAKKLIYIDSKNKPFVYKSEHQKFLGWTTNFKASKPILKSMNKASTTYKYEGQEVRWLPQDVYAIQVEDFKYGIQYGDLEIHYEKNDEGKYRLRKDKLKALSDGVKWLADLRAENWESVNTALNRKSAARVFIGGGPQLPKTATLSQVPVTLQSIQPGQGPSWQSMLSTMPEDQFGSFVGTLGFMPVSKSNPGVSYWSQTVDARAVARKMSTTEEEGFLSYLSRGPRSNITYGGLEFFVVGKTVDIKKTYEEYKGPSSLLVEAISKLGQSAQKVFIIYI